MTVSPTEDPIRDIAARFEWIALTRRAGAFWLRLQPATLGLAVVLVCGPTPSAIAIAPTAAKAAAPRSEEAAAELRRVESTARGVIDRVAPAVVRITTRGRGSATASGVVIDPTGLVLTAGHVVTGRRPRFFVEWPTGEVHPAELLGSVFEGDLDLALLRVTPNEIEPDESPAWPHAPLAPERSLDRGDWVLAIGHAAAISPTAVGEPASRLGRVLAIDRASLAIDSPIDAGDSGGPIVDLEGRVVGIASRCGAAAWQNLATALDAIHAWLPHLEDESIAPPSIDDWTGRIGRRTPAGSKRDPRMLAELGDLTASTEGCVVELRDGDRLVASATVVGPDRVVTKASLLARHAREPIVVQRLGGERVTATAVPIGVDPDLDLVLLDAPGIRRPDSEVLPPRTSPVDAGTIVVIPGDSGDAAAYGIVARDNDELPLDDTPDDRPFLGVATRPSPAGGLLLTTVVANSAAARAGLRDGDRLLTIDGVTVSRPGDLPEALAMRDFGDRVRVGIVRDGEAMDLDVTLGIRPDRSRERLPGNTSFGVSRLSSGFGPVHLVDADRPLHAVGGPALDLDGRLLGWIAAVRARTSLVVVPWDRVAASIARLEPDPAATELRLCSYRVVATESPDAGIGLDAEDAYPDGSTIRRERLGRDGRTTWGDWSAADDALEWQVQLDEPGRFLVRLRTACPTRHAGTPVRFHLGDASTDGRIEGTDDWEDFQWRDLGVIEVTQTGPVTARLEPRARPRRAVCNFESIQLVRLRDAAIDAEEDAPRD